MQRALVFASVLTLLSLVSASEALADWRFRDCRPEVFRFGGGRVIIDRGCPRFLERRGPVVVVPPGSIVIIPREPTLRERFFARRWRHRDDVPPYFRGPYWRYREWR